VCATGKREAFIDVHLALASSETRRTETLISFEAVHTLSAVHARVGVAFLFVMTRLATVARRESIPAVAFNSAICAQLAGSRVFVALRTLFRGAGFNRVHASVALPHVIHPVGETVDASAKEAVHALGTLPAVRARSRQTLIDIHSACIPVPPR